VTADTMACEFKLGEGGFGTEYTPACFIGKTKMDPKLLSKEDFAIVTGKKYAELIDCCSNEACSKFLVKPAARVQPLAGKKTEPTKVLSKK